MENLSNELTIYRQNLRQNPTGFFFRKCRGTRRRTFTGSVAPDVSDLTEWRFHSQHKDSNWTCYETSFFKPDPRSRSFHTHTDPRIACPIFGRFNRSDGCHFRQPTFIADLSKIYLSLSLSLSLSLQNILFSSGIF